LSVVPIHAHVHAVRRTFRTQPAVVVAEIDPNGVAGEDHEALGGQRAVPVIVFFRPQAGDGGDLLGRRVVHADAVGLPVHEGQAVDRIERDGAGIREIYLEGGAVAVEAELAGPGDGVDDPGLHVDPADAVAPGIANVQIALRIKGHIQRQVQPRLGSGPAVAAVTGLPDARHVADDARRQLDASHAIGPGLRIVEGLVLRVDRDTDRQRHACVRCALASASMASASCTDFLKPLMALPSPSPSCGSLPAPKMISTMKRIRTSSVMPMLPNIARSLVSGSGYLSFDSVVARREANRCLSRSRVWSASANRLAFS